MARRGEPWLGSLRYGWVLREVDVEIGFWNGFTAMWDQLADYDSYSWSYSLGFATAITVGNVGWYLLLKAGSAAWRAMWR